MSQVKYRNYTFPSNWSNSIVVGAPRNRVKLINFPGVVGGLSLNMNKAERNLEHTGTIRKPTQASLYATRANVESVCNGALNEATGGGGTSFSLVFHGTQSLSSVYADNVEWGPLRGMRGNGGISVGTTTHYAQPFTIKYIQPKP
jgi:hypothetical protein